MAVERVEFSLVRGEVSRDASVPFHRNPGRDLLSGQRLDKYDCDHRPVGTGEESGRRAYACTRDRRDDRLLSSRPKPDMPGSGDLLRVRARGHWTEPRPPDWARDRADRIHTL